MSLHRTLLLGATALALCLNAQADPKQKQNNQESSYHGQEQPQGKAKHQQQKSQDSDNQQQKQQKHAGKQRDYDQDFDEDEDSIYGIFQQHRGQYAPPQALPPGIAKNLARGKPLPPGIGKRFNPEIVNQLPNYPGYEWQQVGSDAVLINTTSQVVQEVLRGVLR